MRLLALPKVMAESVGRFLPQNLARAFRPRPRTTCTVLSSRTGNPIQVRYLAALRVTKQVPALSYVCCGCPFRLTSLVRCGSLPQWAHCEMALTTL